MTRMTKCIDSPLYPTEPVKRWRMTTGSAEKPRTPLFQFLLSIQRLASHQFLLLVCLPLQMANIRLAFGRSWYGLV